MYYITIRIIGNTVSVDHAQSLRVNKVVPWDISWGGYWLWKCFFPPFPLLESEYILHKWQGAFFIPGQIGIPNKYRWITLSRKWKRKLWKSMKFILVPERKKQHPIFHSSPPNHQLNVISKSMNIMVYVFLFRTRSHSIFVAWDIFEAEEWLAFTYVQAQGTDSLGEAGIGTSPSVFVVLRGLLYQLSGFFSSMKWKT